MMDLIMIVITEQALLILTLILELMVQILDVVTQEITNLVVQKNT